MWNLSASTGVARRVGIAVHEVRDFVSSSPSLITVQGPSQDDVWSNSDSKNQYNYMVIPE